MSILQKQDLSSEDLQLLSSEMTKKKKSSGTTWLLWLFLASLGGHRFYLGKTGSAVAMLLTLGGLGIWSLIDLFLINGMIKNTNEKIENEIISEIRLIKNAKKNSEIASTKE
ncbi:MULTISPECIES: TM2 domain-containing protein [unclassified Bacillus (in: firmicutes)]|uniref:TM2 domain-containing protein n=1 Tax=unclassified Bacillus (in: firmicutes) TaxID=185979 RepID=UPI0008EE1E81|nr:MULTISPECIES: TM2 domain-containing protein [unclassified Bacillus (in: firmicutes)]PGZ92968.1 TM2 domain-containing protein [Bacillus sp. AFS029533]SFD77152.1 TM2 domain-containing protein [Bacillus sp. UNCCL81]